jgi:sulfur carrier protein
VKATVNGRLRDLPDDATIGDLLEQLGSARSGVAVACNDRVVRRAEYHTQRVCDGDRVEIIEAVAGG